MAGFNAFATVLGPALADAGKAYTDALLALPKERRQAEADELALERGRLENAKLRHEAQFPTPRVTRQGLWTFNHETNRWELEKTPTEPKKFAAEVSREQLLEFSKYPEGTPQRQLWEAEIAKLGAPGQNAITRKKEAEERAAYWRKMAETAAGKNAIAEKEYQRRADAELRKAAEFDELLAWRYYNTDEGNLSRRLGPQIRIAPDGSTIIDVGQAFPGVFPGSAGTPAGPGQAPAPAPGGPDPVPQPSLPSPAVRPGRPGRPQRQGTEHVTLPDTRLLYGYVQRFRSMPKDQALQIIRGQNAAGASHKDLVSAITAYSQVYGEPFPDLEEVPSPGKPGSQAPLQPPATTPVETAPRGAPQAAPAPQPSPAGTEPGAVPGSLRVPLAPHKVEEQERKRAEFQRAEEKDRREAWKQARSYADEFDALEKSERLAEMVYKLISPATVGAVGNLRRGSQNLLSVLTQHDPYFRQNVESARQDMLKLLQQPGFQDIPKPAGSKLFDPRADALNVLSSVLAYTHALNIKRGAGGGAGRGVTVQDIETAERIFDPTGWFQSAPALKTALVGLQEFIQSAKPEALRRTQEELGERYFPEFLSNRPEAQRMHSEALRKPQSSAPDVPVTSKKETAVSQAEYDTAIAGLQAKRPGLSREQAIAILRHNGYVVRGQ